MFSQLDTAQRNVAILVIAQAVLGAQLPMIFVVGGLAGQYLAANPCWATLPISLIVFGSMTTAPWLSPLMQRKGRRFGFIIGALAGALGAAVCAVGLYYNSFSIFLLGSYLTGIYMSAQGFFRFAAADTASDDFRPKAISYVMAGGMISAVIGPQLAKATMDTTLTPFLGIYIAVVIINILGSALFFGLNIPIVSKSDESIAPKRTSWEIFTTPRIAVAMLVAMISYALMNLVMTSTPLAVVGCGYTQENAADIVMAHVLGMFVPSLFTGSLIARFGVQKIMVLGLAVLALSGGVNLAGLALENFFIGLILLGIGWNFSFIGATTLLASSHRPEERGLVQGVNDALVFGLVTVASLSSGGLMNCSGGSPQEGWALVNYAMVPFLILAAASMLWLYADTRKNAVR